jgi:hypothetical protein
MRGSIFFNIVQRHPQRLQQHRFPKGRAFGANPARFLPDKDPSSEGFCSVGVELYYVFVSEGRG